MSQTWNTEFETMLAVARQSLQREEAKLRDGEDWWLHLHTSFKLEDNCVLRIVKFHPFDKRSWDGEVTYGFHVIDWNNNPTRKGVYDWDDKDSSLSDTKMGVDKTQRITEDERTQLIKRAEEFNLKVRHDDRTQVREFTWTPPRLLEFAVAVVGTGMLCLSGIPCMHRVKVVCNGANHGEYLIKYATKGEIRWMYEHSGEEVSDHFEWSLTEIGKAKVDDLRASLCARGASVDGNKKELVARLKEIVFNSETII
jgi:hypothetical protein